jgi:methanethiol S-methyltransferase
MSTINYHILLAASLVVWCVLHSAMISQSAISLSKALLKDRVKYYRLFYNAIAALTLLPILAILYSMPKIAYFEWTGYSRLLQLLLISFGLFFLIAGAKSYDGLQFLGLRQIMSKKHRVGLSESGGLHTDGILNVTRHPWYLSGLLVLWGRDIDSAALIVNIVFSAYLVLGALLEERKLVHEFGEDYLVYQSRVSMLFPLKWIVTAFKR